MTDHVPPLWWGQPIEAVIRSPLTHCPDIYRELKTPFACPLGLHGLTNNKWIIKKAITKNTSFYLKSTFFTDTTTFRKTYDKDWILIFNWSREPFHPTYHLTIDIHTQLELVDFKWDNSPEEIMGLVIGIWIPSVEVKSFLRRKQQWWYKYKTLVDCIWSLYLSIIKIYPK